MTTYINADDGIISGVAGLKYGADNSGTLVLQTNGTTAISVSPSQVVTFSGAVSLGALSTSGNLTFTSTSNRILGNFSTADSTNVLFQTSTANSSTYVGAVPSGTGNTAGFAAWNNNSASASAAYAAMLINSSVVAFFSDKGASGTYLPMTFYTGGNERLRIDTAGNVGIGTTSPSYKLDVSGTGAFQQVRVANTAATSLQIANSTSGLTYSLYSANSASNGFNGFGIYDGTAYRLAIDSSGNVGIGTSSPSSKLTVVGSQAFLATTSNGSVSIRDISTTGQEFHIRPSAGKNAYISFTEDAVADKWLVGIEAGNTSLVFKTGNNTASTERIRFTANGGVAFGGSTNYGSSGQVLRSAGDAAPTWGSSLISGTAVASTSGTSIDFTGIPSWVKRITVLFNSVSTSGSSYVQIQSGSGSFETTGYTSSGALVAGNASVTSTGSIASGFVLPPLNGSADARNGALRISNLSGNIWVFEGCISSGGNSGFASGVKSFSGVVDRVRITTVNGTDTFDAGTINIMYE